MNNNQSSANPADTEEKQNSTNPLQPKKDAPHNTKGTRPDVAKTVDPSVSSTSTERNPEADLQDKDIVGQQ